MKKVDKPWGSETWFANNDKYLGKLIYIKKGCRLSKQYHEKKKETFFSIKGNYIIEIEGKELEMQERISVTVNPREIHRLVAPYEDVEIIEVSTPESDDIVRIEDDYNRLEDVH